MPLADGGLCNGMMNNSEQHAIAATPVKALCPKQRKTDRESLT